MKTIRTLPDHVVAKIAAGEVIERPSFAVKELIENALDAKATDIKIHIEDAGLTRIRVADNGIGMSKDDVLESWKSHTTSKISEEEDLMSVQSFGFRGEALSSLAAVSVLTIQSRLRTEPTGYLVTIDNGSVKTSAEAGMAEGTIVTVDKLFAHVPARKKFLRSEKTELKQIIDTVNNAALAHPNVQFTLTNGKKTILYYPETSHPSERIEQVLGSETFSFFIPITKEETYITVDGYIAKPQLTTRSPHKQYIFVNNRPVSDKLISSAVKEAYGTMLESATYPLFVIRIALPSELVDINVHPRKEQVRFADAPYLFKTIKQWVEEVLLDHNLTFQNLSWSKSGAGMTTSFAGKLLKQRVLDQEHFASVEKSSYLQFHRLYIVVAGSDQLLIFDQHAAHERILFEKLKQEFLMQQSSAAPYRLPRPVSLTLTNAEVALLEEYRELLHTLGFSVRGKTLTHVPAILKDREPQSILSELLDHAETTGSLPSLDSVSEEMLAFLACRAAVKAGDPLTEEEMITIVTELDTTKNNTTCPHGRPTRITMSIDELNMQFHR